MNRERDRLAELAVDVILVLQADDAEKWECEIEAIAQIGEWVRREGSDD